MAPTGPAVLIPLHPDTRFEPETSSSLPVQTINQAYLSALSDAGAFPLPVLPDTPWEHLDPALALGLLLPGGADVDPRRYGAPTHSLTQPSPPLDDLEFRLLGWARRLSLPVLGICRGLQVINVALGGSLIQDLGSERPSDVHHPRRAARDVLAHQLTVTPGSRLAAAMGCTEAVVNSLHHQGIDRLAPGLRAVAHAPDGLVEGVESEDGSWLVAVQFHPEELVGNQEFARGIFSAFVGACERVPAPAAT